jgi:DNA-binding SARP family transcriptional activator/predicted ATPase/tetratricopeptide (TPR) repeat protein
MPRQLQIALLGTFQVLLDGEPATRFEYDKVRALLAYLAVEADVPHRRDSLTALLWPEQAESVARKSLNQALYTLRKALGEPKAPAVPFILADRNAVQLNPAATVWLDARAFVKRARVAAGAAELEPAAREQLAGAAGLYRGEFLQGLSLPDSVAFDDWMALTRERLHRLAIETLAALANHHEERGELALAEHYARRQVALEPWHEEAHRQLMRLLAHGGQRTAALAQYERCREALAEELGLTPAPETARLHERILAMGRRAPPGLPVFATPFAGRQQELAEIAALLARRDCRLLTITGPGGSGKTRLAVETATQLRHRFLNGVAWARLGTVATSEELVTAIADSLKFSFRAESDARAQLLDYLRPRELLLVLDSFEQLAPEAGLLGDLLATAPEVKLLVTSRLRLNQAAEWVYELQGLALPEPESVEEAAAGQLFIQSARRARRGFRPEAADRTAIVQICRLVEGLPLALELAASWVRVIPCTEIAARLAGDLTFLAALTAGVAPEHESMRAVYEQSWQLLRGEEQAALQRLSVFRGGFSREAARRAGVSLVTLATLVDNSLLRADRRGRYDFHELLRRYAAEKLAADPALQQQTHEAHASYFASFLADGAPALRQGAGSPARQEMVREMENIRDAWRWLVEQRRGEALAGFLPGLLRLYESQNWYREGAQLLRTAVTRLASDYGDALLLARLKIRQASFAHVLSEYETARSLLEESLPQLRAAGAQQDLALALRTLADVELHTGSDRAAVALLQESVALAEATGDETGRATALTKLGAARHHQGDYAAARGHYEEALHRFQAEEDLPGMGTALHRLGHLTYELGAYGEAQGYYGQSLALAREVGDQWGVAASLNNLGNVHYALGDHEQAEGHYLQALAGWQELGSRWGTALAYNNAGMTQVERGAHEHARQQFWESLRLARALGDRRIIGLALDNLGELAFKQGAYQEAREAHEESLALFRAAGELRGMMYALNYLGDDNLALGEDALAAGHYREALQLALAREATPRALDSLTGLAELLQRQGKVGAARELLLAVVAEPAAEAATRERAAALLAAAGEWLPPAGGEAEAGPGWKALAQRLLAAGPSKPGPGAL